jgi:hypothetical protein
MAIAGNQRPVLAVAGTTEPQVEARIFRASQSRRETQSGGHQRKSHDFLDH